MPPAEESLEAPKHLEQEMQVPVAEGKSTACLLAVAQGTHHVIDVKRCLIQHDANNELTGRRPCLSMNAVSRR